MMENERLIGDGGRDFDERKGEMGSGGGRDGERRRGTDDGGRDGERRRGTDDGGRDGGRGSGGGGDRERRRGTDGGGGDGGGFRRIGAVFTEWAGAFWAPFRNREHRREAIFLDVAL